MLLDLMDPVDEMESPIILSSLEGGAEKGLNAGSGQPLSEIVGAEAEDVRVVSGSGLPRVMRVMGDSGAHAGYLVGDDGHTDAIISNQDAKGHVLFGDHTPHSFCNLWIRSVPGAVEAEADERFAASVQVVLHGQRQRLTMMVGSKRCLAVPRLSPREESAADAPLDEGDHITDGLQTFKDLVGDLSHAKGLVVLDPPDHLGDVQRAGAQLLKEMALLSDLRALEL